MEEIKIYQQIDWNGFHIGTNADLVPGAIDIEAPIYDSLTHKAKLVYNVWVIKPILEWELKEGEIIQDNHLIKLEKPSELHSWDGVEWHLDEEKIRLSKLPSAEELQKNTIEIVVLGLLTEVGVL